MSFACFDVIRCAHEGIRAAAGFLIMETFEVEIKKEIIIAIVILLVLMILGIHFSKTTKEWEDHRVQSFGFEGVVIRKFKDRQNHNDRTIELSSFRKLSPVTAVYNFIEVGDSLVKKQKWLYFFCYKKERGVYKINVSAAENWKKTVTVKLKLILLAFKTTKLC